MGLEGIRDEKGGFERWSWTGSVRDLVNAVGDGDARLGYVLDAKSGAKISMNMNDEAPEGVDERKFEPFYIESPDGDNMYDADNRKEAVRILSNIRRGERYPDVVSDSSRSTAQKRKRPTAKRRSTSTSLVGIKQW